MRAMVLDAPGRPLRLVGLPEPVPGAGDLLVRVAACGVCRTDLHIVDGELPNPKLPLIPGHQIVGVVATAGSGALRFRPGDRVGIPWLGGSCGRCRFCTAGHENLCDEARYTGYQLDGGFAELCVADARFCFPLPAGYPDLEAAPLLCAGLIGFRAYRMAVTPGGAGEVRRIGLFGFGASAHLVAQLARHEGREVFAFTRPGDEAAMGFARRLGCAWAGGTDEAPPAELDAAILFAPAGELVPAALARVGKGGVVVCAGIHMSDLPSFPYRLLWGERIVRSVANLTRQDGEDFLAVAPRVPIRTTVTAWPLEGANDALASLRAGAFTGAAVVRVAGS